jgi:hypothetical protein
MSACMCNVFGRSLWDEEFKVRFFADPVAACRVFEGPATRASGLHALQRRDIEVLDQQIKSIRTTLGADTMKEIADNFGLQMILGRAMIDPSFAKRTASEVDAIVREFLGDTPSAKRAAKVLHSAQFKKLDGFAKHREAMRPSGERFSAGVAHSRVLEGAKGGANVAS